MRDPFLTEAHSRREGRLPKTPGCGKELSLCPAVIVAALCNLLQIRAQSKVQPDGDFGVYKPCFGEDRQCSTRLWFSEIEKSASFARLSMAQIGGDDREEPTNWSMTLPNSRNQLDLLEC